MQSATAKPVTWKDDTTRQYIKPGVWTLVQFNGQSVICPKSNTWAIHEWYLNYVRGTGGDVTKVSVRFVRDPDGVRDITGEHAWATRLTDKESHSWTFKSEVGVCVGILVKHNGSANLVLATRQFKLIPIVTS